MTSNEPWMYGSVPGTRAESLVKMTYVLFVTSKISLPPSHVQNDKNGTPYQAVLPRKVTYRALSLRQKHVQATLACHPTAD